MDENQFIKTLNYGLDRMGINIQKEKKKIFWIYLNFLIQENKKYNLTGIDDPEKIIYKHFLDSLSIINKIEFKKNEKIIDIGTGAGFPGFVLKIVFPEIDLILLDSRLKRIHFLKMLINEQLSEYSYLGDNIKIFHERAEKLAQNNNYRQKFDYVLSRAVAPMNILCEYTLPFLKMNKIAVLYKGKNYQKEIANAEKALTELGGKIVQVKNVEIPKIDKKRVLIYINKIADTPDKYPRKPGIPKKRPL